MGLYKNPELRQGEGQSRVWKHLLISEHMQGDLRTRQGECVYEVPWVCNPLDFKSKQAQYASGQLKGHRSRLSPAFPLQDAEPW